MSQIVTTVDGLVKNLQLIANTPSINHSLSINGQLIVLGGTAPMPGLVFNNDNDSTGLFSIAPELINMSFNGTSGMLFEIDRLNIQATGGHLIMNNGSTIDITPAPFASPITLTIPYPGVSTNFLLGAGNQSGLTGIKTFNNQLVGNGIAYSGTLTALGATPQTLNGRVGTVTFNGVDDTGAGSDLATPQVINNGYVTASTLGLVCVTNQTVNGGACFTVKTVTFGASTITITLNNGGGTTSGGGGSVTLSFILFN